jgi:type IV secretion system protein VirB10
MNDPHTPEPSEDGFVAGERSGTSTDRARSVQSRVSNVLALALMSALGLGTLTWYYAHALMQGRQTQQSAQATSRNRAQGDLPLPSLGRIDPPASLPALVAGPASTQVSGGASLPLEPPLLLAPTSAPAPGVPPAAPPAKSAWQLALERRLSGAAFAAQSTSGGAIPANVAQSPSDGPPVDGFGADPAVLSGVAPVASATSTLASTAAPAGGGDLSSWLRPSITSAVRAQVLPSMRLLLPKGAFIDCTLETAIDSSLPGMTTCVTATDSFGVDGEVVLMERGTKLVGETKGEVSQGAARLFVLWTEARTPAGVIVPLASPGADELGRSGLPGTVNRHFFERFGAAMLVSVIDGAVQAALQSSRGGGGTVIVNPSASQDIMTEVLKGTINIPPTIVKRQGDRIQVMVARDLDFRSVYELRVSSAGH